MRVLRLILTVLFIMFTLNDLCWLFNLWFEFDYSLLITFKLGVYFVCLTENFSNV